MSSRRIFFIIVGVLSLSLVFPLSGTVASATTSSTGIIVSLYSYPGPDWNFVIQQKRANPAVPVIAVVNPNNGPGGYRDGKYADNVNNLRSAGITVLGYVATSYGAKSIEAVKAEINTYQSWYNTGGIFFDEMSNVPGQEWYYSALNNYVKSLGLSLTIGNPGVSVPPSYNGTMDSIIVYENQGLPSIQNLAALTMGHSKNSLAIIVYGENSLDKSFVSSASNYVGYLYITNGVLPAPYSSLPWYFADEISALGSTLSYGTLTIRSADLNGNPTSSLWTVIQSNRVIVASGFTPLTITGVIGTEYSVTVSNYDGRVFSRFNDWSSGSTKVVTLSQDSILTAYYYNSIPASCHVRYCGLGFNG